MTVCHDGLRAGSLLRAHQPSLLWFDSDQRGCVIPVLWFIRVLSETTQPARILRRGQTAAAPLRGFLHGMHFDREPRHSSRMLGNAGAFRQLWAGRCGLTGAPLVRCACLAGGFPRDCRTHRQPAVPPSSASPPGQMGCIPKATDAAFTQNPPDSADGAGGNPS